VRRADGLDLIDIPPELLRQRLSDGEIYPGDKIDAALSDYFQVGNLSTLRELSLLWLADRVDEGITRTTVGCGRRAGVRGRNCLTRRLSCWSCHNVYASSTSSPAQAE
jgi:K+-sensing histidine kinase KdpD